MKGDLIDDIYTRSFYGAYEIVAKPGSDDDLLRECLPWLDAEIFRRTGFNFSPHEDAALRDLAERIRERLGEEKP